MSFVFASPDAVTAAAGDLTTIGSAINAANAAAARSTTQIVAAARDEVSAAIAALFGCHGQEFQALSAQTALFHDEFVRALTSGGFTYAATEAANASGLRTLVEDVLALSAAASVRVGRASPAVAVAAAQTSRSPPVPPVMTQPAATAAPAARRTAPMEAMAAPGTGSGSGGGGGNGAGGGANDGAAGKNN